MTAPFIDSVEERGVTVAEVTDAVAAAVRAICDPILEVRCKEPG